MNVQTNLLGCKVQLVAELRKIMNAPEYVVRIVFADSDGALKVTLQDEYGNIKTVGETDIRVCVPRRW